MMKKYFFSSKKNIRTVDTDSQKPKRFLPLKLRIREKLFLVVLSILVFNLLVTFVFAQTLIGRFYTYSKTRELLAFQSRIRASYAGDASKTAELIDEAEQKNITVLIFTMEDTTATIEYFSRNMVPVPGQSDPSKGRYNPMTWINYAYSNNYLSALDSGSPDDTITLEIHPQFRSGTGAESLSINVLSKIDDSVFLFLETPKEQIEHAAALGIRYMLYISLGTLVLAMAALAIVSKKITTPITKAQQVANKIANLDFSEKCSTDSSDELGEMGRSINRMAETLRENIHRLTVMNAMLREDLEREETSGRIRREFIANVSHDFKTPLTLITAYSEAIRDSMDEPVDMAEIRENCGIIISESLKMDSLVNQLLKLAQLESRTISLDKSMFDLNGMIADTIRNGRIMLRSKDLRVRFDQGPERIAFADYIKIGQVMRNLFENAIKYSSDKSEISITISGESIFRVNIFNKTDTEPADDPNDYFVSFYKGDSARSLEDKSYGLGLAIVKAIVELHGNRCGAFCSDGGINFWFEIAAYTESADI
ncbi:MAG: sensor histidine kinase [Saccharofermentanales bacterium]